MVLFLHEQGYTFFDIPKLTFQEINMLIEAFNKREKKKEEAQKRANRRKK